MGSFFLITAAVLLGWFLWERGRRRAHSVPAGLQSAITLPHSREFELYHNAFSLCSKKSRFCLAELGIEYESHTIDLIETGSYETLSRAFLRVNPAGTVPVLLHEGHPIYESHEQIRYAAAHAPPGQPSLTPDDSDQRKKMQTWIDLSSIQGDDPLNTVDEVAGNATAGLTLPLFAAMMEDIAAWRLIEGLLFHPQKMRPAAFLAMKIKGVRGLKGVPPMVGIIQKSGRAMHRHLDALEEQLRKSAGPWIVGERFTLADVSWAVIFARFEELDVLSVFLHGRPTVDAWYESVRARPAYGVAIRSQVHPTVERGTELLCKAKANDPELKRILETFA